MKGVGLPSGSVVKFLPAMQETQVQSLGKDNPWRRKWQPTPVFLPGESHRQRSLAVYSPWGHKRVGHMDAKLGTSVLCSQCRYTQSNLCTLKEAVIIMSSVLRTKGL